MAKKIPQATQGAVKNSPLDVDSAVRLDRLTRLARSVFAVPIAIVTLVEDDRHWVKSSQGLGMTKLVDESSFCGLTIAASEIFEVNDTHLDTRFVGDPLVAASPHVRFCAGAPLTSTDGDRIGTLCIMDIAPRELGVEQRKALRDLADYVQDEINKLNLQHLRKRLAANETRLSNIIEGLPDIVLVLDRNGRFIDCNDHPDLIAPKSEVVGRLVSELLPAELAERTIRTAVETLETGEPVSFDYDLDLPRGRTEFEARFSKLDDLEVLLVLRDKSEENLANMQLNQQRDFAASLINIAPSIVLVIDTEGIILQVNEYFADLTGYTVEEAVGMDWFANFLPSPTQEDLRRLYKGAALDHLTRSEIYPIVTRTGEVRDIEWNDQFIRDASGKVSGLLAIGLDVTEKKVQADQRRLAMMRLNQAQRIAKVGSWELDLQSGSLEWTDEIYSLFEIDKELFGATYGAFLGSIHPEDREAVNEAYTSSLENRESYSITHRLLMPDGRIKWVEERCNTDFASDGTPLVSRGTVQDISERREIEGDLQLKNTAMATAIEPIIIASAAGEAVYANPAFLVMWRYDSLEALRTDPLNGLWSYSAESEGEARRNLVSGDTWTGQAIANRKDGSRFPVQLSSTGIHDELGQLTHLMSSFVDITDFLRTERLRSEFVSTVSHELRTPLTSISGALGLIAGGALGEVGEQVKEMVTIAHRNSHSLAALVDDLLDMEKITSGKMDFDMRPQPIGPLVDQAMEAANFYRVDRQIELALATEIPEVEVLVDSERLLQVFSNLLSNAIKFSPEGGHVQILVELLETSVRVTVKDEGFGIPESFQSRVFDKFAQLDSSDTRVAGGTGLGLAISRELLEHMSARIDFHSVEGEGSSFFVDLPAW